MIDYEKAYKAVLQTATQWIKDGCTDKEKICLECVFPELRESEDERIRKDLIYDIERLPMQGVLTHRPTSEYIAYLEKQKEIDFTPLDWNDYKDRPIEEWNAYIKGKAVGIEIGKQQKPADRFEEAREKYQVEWSEEDEKILKELIHYFEWLSNCLATEERHAENRRWLSFLKSLRPQPKAELSEDAPKNTRRSIPHPYWV